MILAPPKSGPIASVIRQQPCAQNVMGSIWRRYTTQICRLLISTVENRDFFDIGNVVITFTKLVYVFVWYLGSYFRLGGSYKVFYHEKEFNFL